MINKSPINDSRLGLVYHESDTEKKTNYYNDHENKGSFAENEFLFNSTGRNSFVGFNQHKNFDDEKYFEEKYKIIKMRSEVDY